MTQRSESRFLMLPFFFFFEIKAKGVFLHALHRVQTPIQDAAFNASNILKVILNIKGNSFSW